MPSLDSQKDLLRELEWFSAPAPRSLRETFQLFSLYDSEQGLPALLDRLDLAGVRPDQICRAVLGRPPQDISEATPDRGYDPRRHLQDALLSTEFQSRIVGNLLVAYPEQRRDVFIHVPKCAGTDLILNVGQQRQRLPLPVMLGNEPWISKDELFRTIRSLVQVLPYRDTFFVYGHIALDTYVDAAGVRSSDRLFTVLRDPVDLFVSQANYAVTRLRLDPRGSEPDTREILSALGLDQLPAPVSLSELRNLALRALREPRIARPNPLCFHLSGRHGSAECHNALSNIVSHNIEITTTRQYRSWLWQRWRIMAHSQHNQSDHWLSTRDIGPEVAAYLEDRLAEDRKLFDIVSGVLDDVGTVSVTGSQVAQRLGRHRFTATAAFETFRREPARVDEGRDHSAAEPSVIHGHDAIAARLAERPFGPPPVAMDFGAEGNGRGSLRDGWAVPEANFTWTVAPTCTLELPKPIVGDNYVLRLIGGPFVAKDRLPTQRITLAANGVILGTATSNDRALIEWELPSAVLGGGRTTAYTLWLPDAARPRDVSGAADDRRLGFAVERIEVVVLASEPKASKTALFVIQGKAAIERYLRRRAQQQSVLRLAFGASPENAPLLKDGWAIPEARFTWTSARFSHCETPQPVPVRDYRMRITAGPFVRKDIWPSQRVGISVNGFQLATATVSDRAIIECLLPAAALKAGEVAAFSFGLPDAIRPRSIGASEDDRLLGFAIESIEMFGEAAAEPVQAPSESAPASFASAPETGMAAEIAPDTGLAPAASDGIVDRPATGPTTPLRLTEPVPPAGLPAPEIELPDLMLRFESLGENCEFGLVQRRCGAEPLGLFRFSSAPLPNLLSALEARFEGFGDRDKVAVELSSNGREYMVHDRSYGFLYHAWVLADEMQPEEIREREVRRLPLLTRKLLEDLASGRKLLVVRGMDQPLEADRVAQLLALLRGYGPNTLLWVVPADSEHPQGTVEWAGPHLLKGYIDRFAPGEDAHDLSLDCWVAICRAAERLWRQARSMTSEPVSAAAE